MSNIFGDFRRLVLAALDDMVAAGALPPGLDVGRIAVEPPRDPAHGDLATNAAMVLAGAVKENPMALAERIGAVLGHQELTSGDYRGRDFTVAAARPGFLNIRLDPDILAHFRAANLLFHRFDVGDSEQFMRNQLAQPAHLRQRGSGHGRDLHHKVPFAELRQKVASEKGQSGCRSRHQHI